MTLRKAPMCVKCSRWHKDDPLPTCDAFPAGIPTAIFYGDRLHNRAYPGDNGIRFEAIKKDEDGKAD